MADPSFDPNLDPFEQFLVAHRDIEARVSDLVRAGDEVGDGAKSASALETMARVVAWFEGPGALHQADEEQTLFGQVRSNAAFAQMLGAFEFQHQMNDTTFAQLSAAVRSFAPNAAPKLRELAHMFAEMQRAHMIAEERVLFPAAECALSSEIRKTMRAEMAARR